MEGVVVEWGQGQIRPPGDRQNVEVGTGAVSQQNVEVEKGAAS